MPGYVNLVTSKVDFNNDDLYSIPKLIGAAFCQDEIIKRNCLYNFDHRGQLNNITHEEFTKKLIGKRHVYKACEVSDMQKTIVLPITLYCMDDGILQLNYYNTHSHKKNNAVYVAVVILSSNEAFITNAKALCKEYLLADEDTSGEEIFLLKADRNGISLSAIGTNRTPYIADNYSLLVQDKYNHLLEDLIDPNPCGRLSILSGEPGTGKTFLVKSLLSSGINASFVIVKPDAIESISDPSSVPALIAHHAQYDRPIIIVLEDADSCLTVRGGDNMGRLSAMLNTSDGILGSTLDIRIISTTNAKKVEFDPAVLRPGRLCTHISTEKLPEEQANKIFTRLTGKSFVEAEVELTSKKEDIDLGFSGRNNKNPGYVLAEIYKAAYLYNKSVK